VRLGCGGIKASGSYPKRSNLREAEANPKIKPLEKGKSKDFKERTSQKI
jgi:hypothetical protein